MDSLVPKALKRHFVWVRSMVYALRAGSKMYHSYFGYRVSKAEKL
jgi:hypothetical protein